MQYLAAFTDFFRPRRWGMNLLLTAVCSFIPVIGPLVIVGWLAGGLWGRRQVDFDRFPDFDFARFVDYLQRGLWPFLVSLVASLVLMPVMWLLIALPVFGVAGMSGGGGSSDLAGVMVAVVVGFSILAGFVMMAVFSLLLRPMMLKALLAQDFGAAFDFGFIRAFLSRVWVEVLLSTLFFLLGTIVLQFVGLAALCIGAYFIFGPVMFASEHFGWQLYHLYLERGGAPLAISPKLNDEPPPLPPD